MNKPVFAIIILLLAISASLISYSQTTYVPADKNPNHRSSGTIKVATQLPGNFYIDGKPKKVMTVSHKLLVTGLTPGVHILSLKSGNQEIRQDILVKPEQVVSYTIKPDTIIGEFAEPGEFSESSRLRVHSSYIPRGKGLCGLVKIGFSGAAPGKQSPFYGQIIAGYQFSPKFSLGGGIGFVQTFTHFYYTHITQIYLEHPWEYETMSSSYFSIPFLPLFIDVRVNFSKKRVSPYFASNIGCGFPLRQTFDVEYTKTPYYGYQIDDVSRISKISPGLYFAINPGLKSYLSGKYYLDILFGWDIFINRFYGSLPDGSSSKLKFTSGFHMNIGFGF
ncbi:MAG: hypothetical protein WCK34_09875 [Bacteroidota bacterium]